MVFHEHTDTSNKTEQGHSLTNNDEYVKLNSIVQEQEVEEPQEKQEELKTEYAANWRTVWKKTTHYGEYLDPFILSETKIEKCYNILRGNRI